MVWLERKFEGIELKYALHQRLEDNTPYLRPAVLILAGGGYEHRSRREEEPVALYFLSHGYQAFILDYTVKRENIAQREPEGEVMAALSYIRRHAEEFDIIKNKIVLLGFSAGAHLALSSQCHLKKEDERADALVLGYPVVTTGEYGHNGSTYNITGLNEEKMRYYSLEKEVFSSLPPVFIWQTTEDEAVSAMNSILLSSALLKCHVPFECHLFEKGKHGLSICTHDVNSYEEGASEWLELLFKWLEKKLSYKQ